jgi:predicted nucleic acid-binding protein
MIFLDTNVFLRYLVTPVTANDRAWHERATALFKAIAWGTEEATTSEAVLAEVAFVLNSKRQYNLPPSDVFAYLEPIIRLPNLHLPRGAKRRYQNALSLWSNHPSLGFVDALTATSVTQFGMVLATFDSDFDDLPGILHWQGPPP